MNPDERRYTREHEWIKTENGGKAVIGITAYAQERLGDVVFVELPEIGRELEIGEACGVVESVKAVSDIYAPCAGKVAAVNDALLETPELINQDPYGDGWMVEVELGEMAPDLLNAAAYEQFLVEEEG